MKKINIILIFFSCIISVSIADNKTENNVDSTTAKLNKGQKEHLKIYKTYSTANADKVSQEEIKKMFIAYYSPVAQWCENAEQLYMKSAEAAKEKIEKAENPKQRQQLNIMILAYDRAAKSCKTIRKGFKLNDQIILENNIKKYIALEKEMNQNHIQHPVREWLSSDEGNMLLMKQRQYMRMMQQRQMQIRHTQPQPQPKRQ